MIGETMTMGGNMHNGLMGGRSIRAVLIDRTVGMRELLLPPTMVGKFTFSVGNEQISIIGERVRWKAHITRGGYFSTNNPATGEFIKSNEIVLQNNSLNLAFIGNKSYSLYLEEDSDSSREFQPFYVEKNIDVLIGREAICDIQYMNRLVSREHAAIRYTGDKFIIVDKKSTNGVYVNGTRIQTAELAMGDIVFIMGLTIIVGAGYISMNNVEKCRFTTQRIIPLNRRNDLAFLPPSRVESKYYDRKPRKKYKLDKKEIEIEMPPAPIPKAKIPLALRMGNSVLMGGRALMSGNIFGAVTSMLMPTVTQTLTEKDRKDYENMRTARYREYLAYKAQEIAAEIEYEKNFFNDVFPGFGTTLNFINTQNRLWERRKKDEDFLTVRLGMGTLPMVAEKRYQERGFQMEPDFLEDEMYALAEAPSLLHNVPITASLLDDWIMGVVGNPQKTLLMVIRMIAYIAVTHAYDDVKMIVLASESMKEELYFTKYLQHFWSDDKSVRFFATNTSDVQHISKYLSDKDIFGTNKKSGSFTDDKPKHPAYIVFALDQDLFEQCEILKEMLQKEKYNNISLVAAFEHVPKECSKLIDLRDRDVVINLNDPEVPDIAIALDSVDPTVLKQSMINLSKISLHMESDKSYSLPTMVTFLEMYGVGMVEHLNPLSRWESNNPVKSLAAPIGVGTDGKLFTLDLHEKRQGPHGLVAGMTGSGKSEFIITYILSMAVNFSPDEAAFVLIDYKGGGLADAFVDPKRGIHLPHVVATITNLDGAAIQRSLTSIHSELSRRQEMFKRAKSETGEGTMDIYDYQRLYRNKRVSEPMPHLFIISDEFAELKKQQPEFMDALISAARIGRSLGVHLILATQKPGGVVNDQIWSNTKFRACLRVQDRGDSMEMLKRPEAAELKNTGRFYLQVGYNEFFALGQSAWCGAGYAPQEEMVQEKDTSVDFIDNSGRVILTAKEKKPKVKSESKQIVAIVKYLSDLAKKENIIPRSLWCEPLSSKLEYKDVVEEYGVSSDDGIKALMGLVDDAEHQVQYPLMLDMMSFNHMAVCGTAGSGKSTFFKTMLYSLVMNYTPEDVNFYILDLSGGVLGAFRNMPHCGAYLTKENEADFDRMLALVQEIADERKKLFAEAEVYSYYDYIKINKLPRVFVIIDSWVNINDFAKAQNYLLDIAKNMRNAANYGISFIYSVNHLGEFSAKVKLEIDYRIALQAKDKFDYNDILSLRNAIKPPEFEGRGLCAIDGRALEYQVAVPNCAFDAQTQSAMLKEELQARAEQLQSYRTAKCLAVLDSVMEYADFCKSFALDRIPLGYSMQNMKEIAIPLQQLYTMALYFGNPIGVKPIIFNLLAAFKRENATAAVVRRKSGTIFDRNAENELRAMYGNRFAIFDTTPEDLSKLFDGIVVENIPKYRVPPRNEYCELHGIPESDKGRTVKAAKYIRSKTTPFFVLFESLADLAITDKAGEEAYAEMFSMLRGFNIYFAGCFYPEDESLTSNNTFRNFNKSDFSLFFGGQFNKQWVTNIPAEYKRMEKINPNYNRFVMKYRNDFHRMVMPCGELLAADSDPDEEEII